MNQANIVEQIHREFEIDLLGQLVDKSGISPFLESYVPVSMTFNQLRNIAEHYRIFYPMNNFVTEKQVAEICRKYGLVLGSALNFTGAIPARNAAELNAFKLRDADAVFYDKKIVDRFVRQVTFHPTLSGEFFSSSCGAEQGLRIETIWFDAGRSQNVLPVGDSCVLIAQNDRAEWYDLYLKIFVHGSEWVISFKEISVWSGEMIAHWRHSGTRNGIHSQCKVQLRLMYETLKNLDTLNLNHNVQKSVVAPRDMFGNFAENLEVQSGYRLRFRDNVISSGAVFAQYLNDPIILQPVPGGYLVITKWGDESYLPEFQNSIQN